MKRSSWLPVAGAVLAALALIVTGGSFHATFVEERAIADAATLERRRTLELLLGERMADVLEQRARAAFEALPRAERDPLSPVGGLVLWRRGEQVLPRVARFRAGDATPAADLLGALTRGETVAPDDEPLAARLALLASVRRARALDDAASVERAVRQLLELRATHVAPADVDVPTTLAVLDAAGEGALDARFVEAVLYRGLTIERAVSESLARTLLRGRQRLSEPDFRALARAVDAAAARAGAERPALQDAVRALVPTARPAPPAGDAPELVRLTDDTPVWVSRAGDAVRGLRVDVTEVLDEVASDLPPLLLPADARVALVGSGPDPAAWLQVSAASIEARRDAAVAAYRWKSGLLAGTFGLLLLSLALGALLVHRERRFLALRERFLRTISHELRTPLASLRLLAETLERRVGALDEARDYPRRIVQDVDGLSFLVENVLSFQRFDHGRIEARPQQVALIDALSDIEDELAPLAPAGLEVRRELDAEGVYADPEMLRLVLVNLGRNACLYNDREPVELTVRSRRQDGGVLVEVEDNGVGIPAAERERVFEDFFRGRRDHGAARGSGLGLSLCREVMNAHRGTVRVARSSDAGTCFALFFPEPRETT